MNPRNYWIGVVARNHVERGVAGGFTQLNHGKAGPLERMRAGDGFAYYSPRTEHPDGPPVQAFTAIGRVRDAPDLPGANRAAISGRSAARVDYLPARDAPIRPLLDDLVVHPQQAALGRRVPLRLRARAGGRLRTHRRGHGPRLRRRFRPEPSARRRTRRSAARALSLPPSHGLSEGRRWA